MSRGIFVAYVNGWHQKIQQKKNAKTTALKQLPSMENRHLINVPSVIDLKRDGRKRKMNVKWKKNEGIQASNRGNEKQQQEQQQQQKLST